MYKTKMCKLVQPWFHSRTFILWLLVQLYDFSCLSHSLLRVFFLRLMFTNLHLCLCERYTLWHRTFWRGIGRLPVSYFFGLFFILLLLLLLYHLYAGYLQLYYMPIPLGVMLQAQCASFCGFCNKISCSHLYKDCGLPVYDCMLCVT
jgi:hypothetical protein